MKHYIEKVKSGGAANVKRAVNLLAGITTLMVVIIWLILSTVLKGNKQERVVQEVSGSEEEMTLSEQLGDALYQAQDEFTTQVPSFEYETEPTAVPSELGMDEETGLTTLGDEEATTSATTEVSPEF